MNFKENNNIFQILSCVYTACILTAIIQSAHLIKFVIPFTELPIIFSGGTLIIPIAFFIQNITTENYGFKKSIYLVKFSLVIISFSVLYQYIINFTSSFVSDSDYLNLINNGYFSVFSAIPIHLIGFIFSVFISLFFNDFVISKTKVYFKGKYLYARFMVATIVGEAIYILIAFIVWRPYIDFKTQVIFLSFSYFYRLIFEAATLPLSRFLVEYIKKNECADMYDTNIKYAFLISFFDKIKKNGRKTNE